MPDTVTVQVQGVDDVVAAFRALRDDLPRNVLPNAMAKGARTVAAELQLAAPVGGARDRHAGLLAASIFVKVKRGPRNPSAKVAVRGGAYYWRFLERGWHSRAGNFYRYPFAEPVVRANFEQTVRVIYDAVGRAIQRAAARQSARLSAGG